MPSKPVKPPKTFRHEFGNLLRDILTTQELGVREFGRSIDLDPGFLAGVLKANRLPPLDRLLTWADSLKLHGDKRQEFLDFGYLTHCPDEVWKMVDALKAENRRLKLRVGVK